MRWILFLWCGLFATESFQETLYPAWSQTFEVTRMIHRETTDFGDDIAIFENPLFGRVLAINGIIQVTEKDEAIYHEMLVHPALISHRTPSSVLIIGGGDGGALREVLRHKNIEKVVVVERDAKIIELTKEHMPSLSNGAFNDPRAEIVIEDAAKYVKESPKMFDIIFCDSSNPFTKEFFGLCKNRLNPGGILVNQNGVPFLQTEEFKKSAKARKAHFEQVTFYTAAIPTYVGGVMAFGFASDTKYNVSLQTMRRRLGEKVSGTMKYYTPVIHKASFALLKEK